MKNSLRLFVQTAVFALALLTGVFNGGPSAARGGTPEAGVAAPAAGAEAAPAVSRLIDNQDGTITDPREKLMWIKKDSYQALKKWLNWYMSEDYVKKLNREKFAGHDDWRFPTRRELGTLYEEKFSIPWKYYWTTNEIHMDPVFGNPHCCIWSSESHKEKYAWGFNYIRGKTYISLKDTGVQYSLTAIRPVRNLDHP